MRKYSLLVFRTLFLLSGLLLLCPPFLWLCNIVRVQSPHYFHVIYMGVILVHWWYWHFTVSLYPFLGCHLRVYCIHSYLVNIVHELIFFFFSADELGAIFISTKLHPKEINNLPLILPYRYCDGVLMLLGFYITCFWCVFISVYWFILIICVNLVFFPYIVVPFLHFFVCGVISDIGILLVI